MITDYASLQASVASFLHRTDLTTLIPGFIADAENRIYNDLRVRAMEAAFSSVTSSGTVALPSGLLEWIFLYVNDTTEQKLTRRDAEWIYTRYPDRSSGGRPVFFAREGDTLIFGPSPDADYTITGRYYKKLTALSDSNTTNWLITDAPALLRYGALCEAAQYTHDPANLRTWEAKFATELRRIERTERRESRSGSLLTTKKG